MQYAVRLKEHDEKCNLYIASLFMGEAVFFIKLLRFVRFYFNTFEFKLNMQIWKTKTLRELDVISFGI